MRLNRFLATAGLGSRRSVEKLITGGQVAVNDKIIRDPAVQVEPSDRVKYQGQPVSIPDTEAKVYIILNKPVGVVSTMSTGKEAGPCIADLVSYPVRVFPVGRLDRDSSGLMLLTNDGDLAFKLTHPRYKVDKEYSVKVDRMLTDRDLQRIVRGVVIDSRKVEVTDLIPSRGKRFNLVIHEGRKRIIRRMMGGIGLKVIELKRVRIGSLHLGRLGIGRWRKLKSSEIETLKKEVKG